MGKLGRAAEAAVSLVEDGQRRLHHHANQPRRKLRFSAGEVLRVRQHVHGFIGGLQHFVAAIAIGVGNRHQNFLEARPAPLIDRREIGASVKRPAIRSEEHRQRPATGAGDRGDRELIAAVDIGPLIAIDLHGDELAIDDLRGLGALVGFAIHHVAPVAPHRANVQQDRLVLALRSGEGFLAPLVPLDGLVHCRPQIG